MFRKLRLKLTLINISVMAFLFLLFVFSTYFLMQREIFNQSAQLTQIVAVQAGSVPNTDTRGYYKHLPKYFYVKTDASGNITENSPESGLTPDQLTGLVQRAQRKSGLRGEVDWHDETYTYLRVPLKAGPGFVLAFVSVERDRDILRFLVTALTIGGLLYLGFAFYGSLFLADRALAPIRKSWQRQQDFVADASHELRTPLATIQTNLELVQGNPEETIASQAKWLDYIQLETKRMSKLVNDLLFLARADSQQQLMEKKGFPLHTALYDIFNPFLPVAEAKGIRLEYSLEPEITLYGDESRIKQLVIILLDNALKHTPSGGNITLGLQNRGSAAEITVTDTGEGIGQDHLTKIFERFYRVDKARSKQTGGTGLGLSIADWIVRSHHGTIKVSSVYGTGTTFTVILPNARSQPF
ncbi:MAG: sensor histidine kinase [Desulfitobacteriaceae bacterium]